jgi:hypothetical protein
MRGMRLYVAAAAIAICVALAGCGGQSVAPPSETVQASAVVGSGAPNLLYVLDGYRDRDLSVFALPHGTPKKAVVMPGYGEGGMCSDSRGHVFVPADGAIFEYAHGGKTPIAELIASSQPMNCASDPKTGDLAVTEFPEGSPPECTIAVYKDAKGSATTLHDSSFTICEYPTYDDHGDLFFDGWTGSQSVLTELPAGSETYVRITLNRSIPDFYLLQWDGHDVAIQARQLGSADQPVVIYRTHVAGSKGTVVAKLLFDGWTPGEGPFWIQGDRIVAPFRETHTLGVWKYPQGGKALDTFPGPNGADGLTVSVAP